MSSFRAAASIFLFFVLWVPSEQTDSERDEPTYKFGIVAGEPNSLDNSTSVSVSSFEECVQKCEEDYQCILASQVADGEPCNLFPWNSVTGVKNNASGGVGQVAFRLYTNQPACELNLPNLLNGKNYPLLANDTEAYLWKIDTSEDGWTITYTRKILEDNLICGNWSSIARPYSDGCSEECNTTMVQVYAQPGPLSAKNTKTTNVTSWEECMNACYSWIRCQTAWLGEGSTTCWMYQVGGILLMERKTAADGTRMAIKLQLSQTTCKYSTEKLLNDVYYVAHPVLLAPYKRNFYRVRTTEKYYTISNYQDENGNYDMVQGCPDQWLPSSWNWYNYSQACMRPFLLDGVTQLEAKSLCELFDGHLYVERRTDWMNKNMARDDGLKLRTGYVLYPENWGFGGQTTNLSVWIGLEKDPECIGADSGSSYCQGNQKWQWSNPSWALLPVPTPENKIAMTWASGEPAESDDKKCAYIKLDDTMPAGYGFYSESCDKTMDGFLCGVDLQQRSGVKSYVSVQESYGPQVDQPCCSYSLEDLAYSQEHP